MRQGENLRAEEWEITRADGGKRTLSISTVFVGSEHGAAHILAIMRDITEQKQAEAERLQRAQELHEILKMESLDRMAGATAHHFNNMLGAILGYLELSQQDIPKESPARRFLSNAALATQRAIELSQFMLRYACPGDNEKNEQDLSALVQQSASLIKTSFPLNTNVQIQLGSDLPTVQINADDFHQILINLTTNAAEALGKAGGVVKVATGTGYFDENSMKIVANAVIPPPGNYVFVEVSDNGCGMDQETVARMFDPFFSTKFVGRGLGMALVNSIVRSCQGGIFVETEVHKGTTVRILLPAGSAPLP